MFNRINNSVKWLDWKMLALTNIYFVVCRQDTQKIQVVPKLNFGIPWISGYCQFQILHGLGMATSLNNWHLVSKMAHSQQQKGHIFLFLKKGVPWPLCSTANELGMKWVLINIIVYIHQYVAGLLKSVMSYQENTAGLISMSYITVTYFELAHLAYRVYCQAIGNKLVAHNFSKHKGSHI